VHCRVVVEQRQKHDHAFGDRGTEPRIEPTPPVEIPAVEGLELVCVDVSRAFESETSAQLSSVIWT
jgi:hypothetical protein